MSQSSLQIIVDVISGTTFEFQTHKKLFGINVVMLGEVEDVVAVFVKGVRQLRDKAGPVHRLNLQNKFLSILVVLYRTVDAGSVGQLAPWSLIMTSGCRDTVE